MRLGAYTDQVYRFDGESLSTNRAFVRFLTNLPPRVDEIVVFGRLDPKPGRSPYTLPNEAVEFVPLPHYPNVKSLGILLRSLRRSWATFAGALGGLDAVWIFGPNPMALVFAWIARRHRTPLFLGVRQDYPSYISNRLPGKGWLWAVPIAYALDRAFRWLARRAPTVVLGEELARNYSGAAAVLNIGFSLVRRSDLVEVDEALAKSWDGDLRLLSVGRLHPEKNPLLLAEILAGLRARDPRWRLSVAGEGPLQPALEQRIAELGLSPAVDLLGEVPNGPALWELYRSSHAFLHVSLTEGLPQVLVEAQAAGLPIVATDVGGVRAALDGGATGLLVPPKDAPAAMEALEGLALDQSLRRRLVKAGLETAASQTLEAQLDHLEEFLQTHLHTTTRAAQPRSVAVSPVVRAAPRSPASSASPTRLSSRGAWAHRRPPFR